MKYDLKNNYKLECAEEYFNKLKEKKAWIELREIRMKRSIDQNALYWLWLTCIEIEGSQDRNELHYLYRALFLQKEDYYIETIIRPELWQKVKVKISEFIYFEGLNLIIDIISKSTTELESDEFTEYLSKIQKHARVNFNIILLNLKDKNFEEFYREYGFL